MNLSQIVVMHAHIIRVMFVIHQCCVSLVDVLGQGRIAA